MLSLDTFCYLEELENAKGSNVPDVQGLKRLLTGPLTENFILLLMTFFWFNFVTPL